MSRAWINGWQMQASALAELRGLLNAENEPLLSYESVTDGDFDAWLETSAEQLSSGVDTLVGWSLGGLLATHLAAKASNIKKVFLMATNVRFAGELALPVDIAEGFRQRYQQRPDQTRKRFAALVNALNPSDISPHLLSGDHLATLNWLYDHECVLPASATEIHLLLAEDDSLVPATDAALAWQGKATTITTFEGDHSLPLTSPAQVAHWIQSHE